MEFEQILKICKENTPFHLDKSDSRYERSLELEKDIGFRYEETWNLDYTLATFILPRLAYFRKELHSFPSGMTLEMWKNILDTMIQGFCLKVSKDDFRWTQEDRDIWQKTKNLLVKHYDDLWD